MVATTKPDSTIKKSQRKTTALTKKIEKLTQQLQQLQEKLKEDVLARIPPEPAPPLPSASPAVGV